jgi:hypothetical protein
MTVSGFTIATESAHRDQTRESMTQKARSMARSVGRGRRRFIVGVTAESDSPLRYARPTATSSIGPGSPAGNEFLATTGRI